MNEKTLDFQGKAQGTLQGVQGADHARGIANWIGTLLSVVMVAGVLILLYYLIMGAFNWLTSGGDKSKVEEARNKITTAIIGILLLSCVLAIVMFVQYILGIEVLYFGPLNPATNPGPTPFPNVPTNPGPTPFDTFIPTGG